MSWKDWPYWLKGIILVFILWIIYIILAGLFGLIFLGGNCTPCEAMVGAECEQHTTDCFTEFSVNYYLPSAIFGISVDNHIASFIISTITWILTGILIGLIYGKIKSKNIKKRRFMK